MMMMMNDANASACQNPKPKTQKPKKTFFMRNKHTFEINVSIINHPDDDTNDSDAHNNHDR
jgi:hypothetical protein